LQENPVTVLGNTVLSGAITIAQNETHERN